MNIRECELLVMMHVVACIPLPKTEPTAEQILDAVAKALYILPEDIKGKSKQRVFADARKIAAYLIWNTCDLSLAEIGQMMGGRDHSTIIYARDAAEDLRANDTRFLAKMLIAERKLEGIV